MCVNLPHTSSIDRLPVGLVLVLCLAGFATPASGADVRRAQALPWVATTSDGAARTRNPNEHHQPSNFSAATPFDVRVEVEETVCEIPAYDATNNGSGMFWSSGSTQMVRAGDRLFASAFESVPGVAPLNNARWALFERRPEGWKLCRRDETDRTREPCSLATSHAGRLLMSVNPTLAPPVPAPAKAAGGPARPEFLEFDPANPEREPRHLVPKWSENPKFTEHSYRAFSADGQSGEFILFNLDDTMDDGGTVGLGDSWLAPDGRLHVVWTKHPINPGLRDTHFPDIKRDWRMGYGVLKDGKILDRRVLLAGGETTGPLRPTGYIGHPRFHVTPDHTMYVLCNLEGATPETESQTGTYAVRIESDGSVSAPVPVPLARRIPGTFFTATPRAGNRLTEAADLLIADTVDGKLVARYARIRFHKRPPFPLSGLERVGSVHSRRCYFDGRLMRSSRP